MKILVFSDLHAHNHNQFSTRTADGLNTRLLDCLSVIDKVRETCRDRQISHVVFLGDLFHSRTKIDVDVFSLTFRKMRELAKEVTSLTLLAGNHDQSARVGDIHSLEPFSEFATVVDDPMVISGPMAWKVGADEGQTITRPSMVAMPYMADLGRMRNILVGLKCDILFLHQPIREAIPGATNIAAKAIINGEDLENHNIKWIISGDIHKGQQLFGGRMKYVGSPLQLTFGERDDRKGISILDTNDGSLELVETDCPKFHWLKELPHKNDLKKMNTERDFIRINYDRKQWSKVQEWKREFPRVQFDMLKDDKTVLQEAVPESSIGDDAQLLREYIRQVGCGDMDADRLLKIGLDELSGAIQ